MPTWCVLLLLTRCVKRAKTQYSVFKCSEATGSASVTTEKWFFLSDHVPCLTHHPHSQSPQSVPLTDPLYLISLFPVAVLTVWHPPKTSLLWKFLKFIPKRSAWVFRVVQHSNMKLNWSLFCLKNLYGNSVLTHPSSSAYRYQGRGGAAGYPSYHKARGGAQIASLSQS